MLVKELKIGNTICRIYDDYVIKSPEKIQEKLDRIGEIAAEAEERRQKGGTA